MNDLYTKHKSVEEVMKEYGFAVESVVTKAEGITSARKRNR